MSASILSGFTESAGGTTSDGLDSWLQNLSQSQALEERDNERQGVPLTITSHPNLPHWHHLRKENDDRVGEGLCAGGEGVPQHHESDCQCVGDEVCIRCTRGDLVDIPQHLVPMMKIENRGKDLFGEIFEVFMPRDVATRLGF